MASEKVSYVKKILVVNSSVEDVLVDIAAHGVVIGFPK